MRIILGLATVLLTVSTVVTSSLPALSRPGTLSTADANGQVNIRNAANTRSRILRRLPSGTAVEVLNIFRAEDGAYWYYFRDAQSGLEGWVNGGYVRFTPSDRRYGTLNGSRDDKINIRSSPSLQSKVMHIGLVGDLVVVERESMSEAGRRWYYVEFPSRAKGWVREDLIQVWQKGCIITCPAT